MNGPGASNVYGRREGSGTAQILGRSSWDPVAFAKHAGAIRGAQEQAQKAKGDKELFDFYKTLKVKGAKVLTDDRNYLNELENDFYNQIVEEVSANGGQGVTPQMRVRGEQYANNLKNNQLKLIGHEQKVDAYHKIISADKGQTYDTEEMFKNEAIYTQPYRFLDIPEVNDTWTPIYEEMMKDPVNARNPKRTATEATLQWRDEYGEDLLAPIYNPISLQANFDKNVKDLLPEIKNASTVRDANGNTISKEEAYTLPEDSVVTVEYGDGSKGEVKIPGVRTIAGQNFDTDVIVQKSAKTLFNKQDDTVKQEYVDQYGDDAVKTWYQDQAQDWGLQATSKKITQAPLPKTGSYRYGKTSLPFEVTLDEGLFNYNQLGTFTEGQDKGIVYSYAKVPMQGMNFGSDKSKYPKIKINPKDIFNQNSYSWEGANPSQEFDFTVSGVYRAPALTQDISLDDPRLKGFKEWAYKTYGAKANTTLSKLFLSGEKSVLAKKNTPLSEDEAKELNKYIPGLVNTQYFASGQVQGYDEANQKGFEIPGATIPLDQVQERLAPATNDIDWKSEIDSQYGDTPDWWKKTVVVKKPKETSPKTEEVDIIEETKKKLGGGGGRKTLE